MRFSRIGVGVAVGALVVFSVALAYAEPPRHGPRQQPASINVVPKASAAAHAGASARADAAATASPTLTANPAASATGGLGGAGGMGGAGGLGGSTGPVVSSNDYRTESRTTALAFGTSASIPYGDVPRCYLPARGFKRVRAGGWGAFDLGPVIERDEQCMDDLEAQRQHERDMLELELARLRQQAENDRIAMERMRAVMECDRCQAK